MQQKFEDWLVRLALSDVHWLTRIMVRALRYLWRHRPFPMEPSPKAAHTFPTGPYRTARPRQLGDLLLWVPRHINSYLIDDLTGGFGYSHITIDTGEVDVPSGKPVMAEVTVGEKVQRKFLDEYPGRPYARIPLAETGVDGNAFVDCVKSKLGQPYDNLEALTLGEVKDPAKEVCTSLASDCLPETLRSAIAQVRHRGLVRGMAISVHSPPDARKTDVFISPNGFAEYYGAPKGKKVAAGGVLVQPEPMQATDTAVAQAYGWKIVWLLSLSGLLAVGAWLLVRRREELIA